MPVQNHLWWTATDKLESSTILDVLPLKPGMSLTVSDKTGIWNETTHDFDPRPETKVISRLEFTDLFTDAELEAIIAKSRENTPQGHKVEVFLTKLKLADSVDLRSNRTITAVDGMESLQLIAAGRAAEILA